MKLILLFCILPFVENLNRTRRIRKGDNFYEPISAIDFAFDDFPKLSDVLPTLVQDTSLSYDEMPGVRVSNISIDMDKININKFRKKIGAIADIFEKDEPKFNASRRQALLNPSVRSRYLKAADQMVRRKCLDVMLQVLYMARHKLFKLESEKHFSTTDTGFRIAYTYIMLTRIYTKMMRIWTYQYKKKDYYNHPNTQILLHGRVTRLHVDFCYLYWVLINVDGTFKKAKGIRKAKQKIYEQLELQLKAQSDGTNLGNSGNPGTSGNPTTPGGPGIPTTPGGPGIPKIPGGSGIPKIPGGSGIPKTPGKD